MLGGGRSGGGDRGLEPRARAPPRGRDPLRGRDLHQPDPGPPRLPPDDGGLLPRQAPAVHRSRARARGHQPRRPRTGRGWRRELPSPVTFGIELAGRRPTAPPSSQTGLTGSRFTLHGPRRRPCGRLAADRPLQRAERPRRVRRRAGARRSGARRAWRRSAPPARCPGRFQAVDEGQPFAVLVDYAHTPDSLENVLRAARGLTEGRLHVVFGAGGDRDRTKRPLMGEIAGRLADRVIVTSDNPRSEDPEAIIAEILAGCGPAPSTRSTGGWRSSGRSAERRARRRRRDRRQGARAGPGVRRRTQGPVRRRHRRPRGAAAHLGRDERARTIDPSAELGAGRGGRARGVHRRRCAGSAPAARSARTRSSTPGPRSAPAA